MMSTVVPGGVRRPRKARAGTQPGSWTMCTPRSRMPIPMNRTCGPGRPQPAARGGRVCRIGQVAHPVVHGGDPHDHLGRLSVRQHLARPAVHPGEFRAEWSGSVPRDAPPRSPRYSRSRISRLGTCAIKLKPLARAHLRSAATTPWPCPPGRPPHDTGMGHGLRATRRIDGLEEAQRQRQWRAAPAGRCHVRPGSMDYSSNSRLCGFRGSGFCRWASSRITICLRICSGLMRSSAPLLRTS